MVMNMTTTTTICFSWDKAYSDALDILLRAEYAVTDEDAFEGRPAEDWLLNAWLYLSQQWAELQQARMARMRSEVTPKP